MLLNKDEFSDRKKIYDLLVLFEQRHKEKDAVAMASILKRLEKYKITIRISTEQEVLDYSKSVTTSTSMEQ